MAGNCEICKGYISVTHKRIKCTICHYLYHSECIGLSGDLSSVRTHWKCQKCVNGTAQLKGRDRNNTPPISTDKQTQRKTMRSTPTTTSEQLQPCDNDQDNASHISHINNSDLIKHFEKLLDTKLSLIKNEIIEDLKSSIFKELKNEITLLAAEFSQLQASYNLIQSENENLKSDLGKLQDRVNVTETQLSDIRAQFSRQQQQARLNNLEIIGVPQTNRESPIDLVIKIAQHAGVDLNPGDIEFAHRVQPLKNVPDRPKPIVAKLRNRILKDQILSNLKRKQGVKTTDIGFGGSGKKLFVNEHLTPENKQLLRATKTQAREKGYKFVWVRNCIIHSRRNEESPALVILQEKDLKKLN